jgi:hypothetical protein
MQTGAHVLVRIVDQSRDGNMSKIHGQRVNLIEGAADEVAPNAELAANMHGVAIMVPPGEGGERLLDMLWRITMAYEGMSRLLTSGANVRKMVEAVMSYEIWELKPVRRPARKSRSDDLGVAKAESLPGPGVGRKARTRQRN